MSQRDPAHWYVERGEWIGMAVWGAVLTLVRASGAARNHN